MCLVSIVTPTFNAREVLTGCLENVAGQTDLHMEHLVVDGGSTDGSVDVLRQFADSHPHLRWLSGPDQGIYDAMNKGIGLARGHWLYFLGADDRLLTPASLANLLHAGLATGADVVYGNVRLLGSGQVYGGSFSALDLMRRNICHQAILFRRRVFDRHGDYDLRYRCLADHAFNMRWFNDPGLRVLHVPETVAVYNEAGFSNQHHDACFFTDKHQLIRQYFPWWQYLAFRLTPARLLHWQDRRRRQTT